MQRLFKNRTVLSAVPWYIDATVARWRRKQGRYDKRTLACYYTAWRKQPSLTNLFAYLRFRRDLGFVAPRRLVEPLFAYFPKSNAKAQRGVINWLWEGKQAAGLEAISTDTLRNLAVSSPPAAAAIAQRDDSLTVKEKVLVLLQNQQGHWRNEFFAYLNMNQRGICVVGNAATLVNSTIGQRIDSHPVVFRFNQFSTVTLASESDSNQMKVRRAIGSRLNVWVCAPNLRTSKPPGVDLAEWVIVTGPDVRYQLADWSLIIPLLDAGKRVLTVPLAVWRSLVRELEAPPSAGILCLAWLIDMFGSPDGLVAAGFQRRVLPDVRYHYALPRHKPSQRHNWEGERALLRRWQAEGLQFLD